MVVTITISYIPPGDISILRDSVRETEDELFRFSLSTPLSATPSPCRWRVGCAGQLVAACGASASWVPGQTVEPSDIISPLEAVAVLQRATPKIAVRSSTFVHACTTVLAKDSRGKFRCVDSGRVTTEASYWRAVVVPASQNS